MSSEFLNDLFGDQEGIVYSPVKGRVWEQHFFTWPQERDKLERHINDFNTRDVYISPVLFTEKRISPETFKGTYHLWTEFDGNSKSVSKDVIEPTIRVQSSVEGHEHWYWRLDRFIEDKAIVEDFTRRIAYAYEADLSVWDYQNVLRPVDTWNHKRNRPVSLLTRNSKTYKIDDFIRLPIPPVGTRVDLKLGNLPSKDIILAKYRWGVETLDLLFKDDVPQGKRSDALTRLAYDAVEAGCSNEEIYVLLEDRDSVWGKYVGRNDREKRLQSFISYVRGRKSQTAEIVQEAPEVYRYLDFMNTDFKLEWVVEGLLPVAGSMVIFGKPGIGKSTFSLRLIEDIAMGRETFLGWKIKKRQRTLFVSLEMQEYELKHFFEEMKLSQEEGKELQDWFHIWPIGHAYPLDTPDQQIEFLKYIDMFKIDLVVIDSLSLSMYGSVKDDDAVKRLNSFLNEDVRKKRKCGYIFIHHPRKGGIDQVKKADDQDDSFGSTYINANAQTVAVLSSKPGSPRVQVNLLKTRMSLGMKNFEIERTSNRGFQIVGTLNTGISTTPEPRVSTSDEGGTPPSLGKLLDF
jgi:AAA domain